MQLNKAVHTVLITHANTRHYTLVRIFKKHANTIITIITHANTDTTHLLGSLKSTLIQTKKLYVYMYVNTTTHRGIH